MKKAFFFCSCLVMLCLAGSPCFAQTKFGFGAGLNYSYLRHILQDSDQQKALRNATEPKIGFSAGVMADYKLSKSFSLQTGLHWVNKGEKYKDKGTDMNIEFEYEQRTAVNFLEVPVHAALTVRKFQVFTGPYIGIGITGSKKSEFDGVVNGVPESNEETLRIKFRQTLPANFTPENGVLYMRRLDYGVTAGLGYQAGPALIRVSYAWGLANNITRQEGNDTYGDTKSFYCVPSLTVTYFLQK